METLTLNFKLEQEWPEYKTAVFRLEGDYPLRLILRGGRIVASVKSLYSVIPLEEVEGVVNKVVETFNLTPKEKYDTGARLYAFYMSPIEEDFQDGSKISVGIYALNSLDGSTSLRFDIFTYRNLCKNIAMLALSKYYEGVPLDQIKRMVKRYRGDDADFGIIGAFKARHTKKGKNMWEIFKDRIESLLPLGRKILEIYKTWEEKEFTKERIEALIENKLPKSVFKDVVEFNDDGEVDTILADNLLDAYNKIVENIWHRQTSIKTKEVAFKRLHNVLLAPELSIPSP